MVESTIHTYEEAFYDDESINWTTKDQDAEGINERPGISSQLFLLGWDGRTQTPPPLPTLTTAPAQERHHKRNRSSGERRAVASDVLERNREQAPAMESDGICDERQIWSAYTKQGLRWRRFLVHSVASFPVNLDSELVVPTCVRELSHHLLVLAPTPLELLGRRAGDPA
ncbi:hypothetical protein PIB30_029680 [Stylosanthes scabra]|uniref:Uncharacterized protein n=1 Tax=Stylosanthes scabra TaxID=79078 RepID=A0ABU6UBK9_9FABA|nr:hypothetical protein [Stylosanthes scabra]